MSDQPVGLAVEDRRLTTYYVRVVALLLLGAGLARAAIVFGMLPEGQAFETSSRAWQAATVTLALVDVFAAVGLWMGAAWGPVVWAVAITVEVAMHTIFADVFGAEPLRIALHGVLFGLFLILVLVDWRRSESD